MDEWNLRITEPEVRNALSYLIDVGIGVIILYLARGVKYAWKEYKKQKDIEVIIHTTRGAIARLFVGVFAMIVLCDGITFALIKLF
ncbi:MAG: hypothetical protein KGH93_03280 [Patescibacteria group bacterium]|nr:hypothetical protein [Patescibacteria group bacterium]